MYECCVPGCNRAAELEVILYDFYLNDGGEVLSEQDFTCPYICAEHAVKNEKQAEGLREPRGSVVYPYTNQNKAQGFTIYRTSICRFEVIATEVEGLAYFLMVSI